jgi:hypothetical protein
MHLSRPDLAGEMTLHGCLKTQTRYDEHTTWAHILNPPLTSLEPGMSAEIRRCGLRGWIAYSSDADS